MPPSTAEWKNMGYRRFYFSLLLRVLIIAVLIVLALYCFFISSLILTGSLLTLIIVLTVTELFYYVNRTNRDLFSFLQSIKYHDFSNRYSEKGRQKSSRELRKMFNIVIDEFQKLKEAREFHYQFLQTILENIPIGIICIEEGRKISIYNRAGKNLLGIEHIVDDEHLRKLNPELHRMIRNMRPGYHEMIRIVRNSEQFDVSVKCMNFILNEKEYTLVTLQNIKSELDYQEVESWQKLIRVLTHEIMNSVTPISSLSSTIQELAAEEYNRQKENENLLDVKQGIEAISNRSRGLMTFVENYRSIARIPKPVPARIQVKAVFMRILSLMRNNIESQHVKIMLNVNEDLYVYADASQVEQVMINLVQNALDALIQVNEPFIELSAQMEGEAVVCTVRDNGSGIPADLIDKIFIPFFTTREKGNGIGLSLSRQMLLLNRATIHVKSKQDEGTAFRISFYGKEN